MALAVGLESYVDLEEAEAQAARMPLHPGLPAWRGLNEAAKEELLIRSGEILTAILPTALRLGGPDPVDPGAIPGRLSKAAVIVALDETDPNNEGALSAEARRLLVNEGLIRPGGFRAHVF